MHGDFRGPSLGVMFVNIVVLLY